MAKTTKVPVTFPHTYDHFQPTFSIYFFVEGAYQAATLWKLELTWPWQWTVIRSE